MSTAVAYRRSMKPWVILIACCVVDAIGFTIPAISFSVYLVPIRDSLGLSMAEVQMYNTFCMIATIVTTMFGARIIRVGVGKVIAISSLGVIAGFYLLANVPSVATITVSGILSGLAYPLLSIYTMPVVISNWFYKRQGTWISVCIASSGIGGFIMSPTVTTLIAAFGWQQAMMIASLAMVVPFLLGALLIRLSPLPQGILPQGATVDDVLAAQKRKHDAAAANAANTDAALAPGATFAQAVKNPAFFSIAVVTFCIGLLSAYSTNLNPLVQSAGYTAATAGIALSASSLGNLLGKPIMGVIRDRAGAFFAGFCGFFTQTVGLCLYLAGMFVLCEPLMIVAAFVGGLGGCAGLIMPSLYVKDAFGSREFDRIYSVQMGIRSVGASVAAPCVSLLFDATGGYVVPVVLWIVACVMIFPTSLYGIKKGRTLWNGPTRVFGRPVDVKLDR